MQRKNNLTSYLYNLLTIQVETALIKRIHNNMITL